MEKVCCFTGHRDLSGADITSLEKKVLIEVLELVKKGVTEFRCGGAVGFDMLAADVVLKVKTGFPDIKLIIYVPCLDQSSRYSSEQKKKYLRQINSADKILSISQKYTSGCMLARDRAMVNGSDVCIAYLKKQTGGTAYTVRYAEKNNCRVVRV